MWQFPAAVLEDGETLRGAAERTLASSVGRRHAVYFVGNAPMAHLASAATDGADAFYMLAQVRGRGACLGPWMCLPCRIVLMRSTCRHRCVAVAHHGHAVAVDSCFGLRNKFRFGALSEPNMPYLKYGMCIGLPGT